MPRWTFTVLLALLAPTLTPVAEAKPAVGSAHQCTRITAVPRQMGVGYDHVVHVENGCGKQVRCEVWTDADPKPSHALTVAAGGSGDAITRRGSPSSVFKALGSCKF